MAEVCFWLLVSVCHYDLHLTVSELIFHPFRQWFTKGPITPLFRQFIWSSIPLHSKFSICAYIFSYYAIAISWILTVANFFLVGLGRKLSSSMNHHS
jgi:hypothetical protein